MQGSDLIHEGANYKYMSSVLQHDLLRKPKYALGVS